METHPVPQRMTAEVFESTFGEAEREDRVTPQGVPDLELVDGIVVEGEVPGFAHQEVCYQLRQQLDPWVRSRGGRIWMNAEVRFGPYEVREPDLIAWWTGQRARQSGQFTAIPDLIIEVISPTPRDVRRDREEKAQFYADAGVPHYWLIEPVNRTFEAFLRQMTRGPVRGWEYRRTECATRGTVEVLAFDGFTLDLDDLWCECEP